MFGWGCRTTKILYEMKKILSLIVFVVTSFISLNAQEKIQWEGVLGMNISKFNLEGYSSRVGFNVGAKAKMALPSLSDGVYANAGALLSLKGASLDWGDLANGKSNAYYLEIPIHLGYQYAINENFSIFGEFGPYFAFGLFGKTDASGLDWDGNGEMITTSDSHNTFDEFKRFDFGLGLRFGAEFKQKYSLSIGYDFGLTNCWNKDYEFGEEDDYGETIDLVNKVKNRNLYISLGYIF